MSLIVPMQVQAVILRGNSEQALAGLRLLRKISTGYSDNLPFLIKRGGPVSGAEKC
jgi:hypothetical protein